MVQDTHWTSRNAFLLTTIGAAVGLGNLWRFPYIAGENGGGGFVVIYLFFVFAFGLPIMLAEMVIGRAGKQDALSSMKTIIAENQAHRGWRAIGWISLWVPFLGLSYYAVVAAWSLDYLALAVTGEFSDLSSQAAPGLFAQRAGTWPTQILLHGLFIALSAIFVGLGITRGLERAARLAMPLLLCILVFLVVHNLVSSNFAQALDFLFSLDLTRFSSETVLLALGQALFSLAIGVGVMITFSAYVPNSVSLGQCALVICIADTLVALLAGLAIFPIVFEAGLDPAQGPSLLFVTLPLAFGGIHWTWFLSTLFFLLLFFAAFTTALGMLEPLTAYFKNKTGLSRYQTTLWVAFATWLLGVLSVLSFGPIQNWFPLQVFGLFSDKNFFDILDFFVANVLLPINALLIALFVGWSMSTKNVKNQLNTIGQTWFSIWRFLTRFFVPACVAVVVYDLWIQ